MTGNTKIVCETTPEQFLVYPFALEHLCASQAGRARRRGKIGKFEQFGLLASVTALLVLAISIS